MNALIASRLCLTIAAATLVAGCGGADDAVALCEQGCDRIAECGAEQGFPVSATACKADCQAGEPEDVSQDCIDKSEAALECYEAASCEELFSGEVCGDEVMAVDAACPDSSSSSNNTPFMCTNVDCSMCPTTQVESACTSTLEACTDQACCSMAATNFALCVGGDSDACGYDCALCTDATLANACGAGQSACGQLSGQQQTDCCDSFTSTYEMTCGS